MKYDYSLLRIDFTNKLPREDDKIRIICPIHGVFTTRYGNHKRKKTKCPTCAGVKRGTTSDFIENSKKKYGARFDYTKSVYVSVDDEITITCNIDDHGDFITTPYRHLSIKSKGGCKKCSHIRDSIYTDDDLIIEAQKWLCRVDYKRNNPNYYHASVKRGKDFHKMACNHMDRPIIHNKSNTNQFIRKAKLTHKNKYDYSLVDYVNSHKPVKIICGFHGIFEQIPVSHINGGNCPNCVGGIKLTVNEFIGKSNAIHNDTYDYSKVNYINTKSKVIIVCRLHNEFLQTPDAHLRGQGCPECGKIKLSKIRLNYAKTFRDKTRKS